MGREEKTYGPFVAHTTATTARLWLRAGTALRGDDVQVFARLCDPDTNELLEEQRFSFAPEFDHIGLVEFGIQARLAEDTTYRYRISVNPRPATEYLPSPDSGELTTFSSDTTRKISFVTGSCRHLYTPLGQLIVYLFNRFQKLRYGDQAFRTIQRKAEQSGDGEGLPDFMIMTGDQVYADHEEGAFTPQRIEPHAFTREEYFDSYYRAYEQEYFSYIGARVPMYMTMDDHEIENDWHMDMIKTPEHNELKEASKHRKRYENGLTAYLAYQAALSGVIKQTATLATELADLGDTSYETGRALKDKAPYKDRSKGLWYKFQHGPARFFCLDVRLERYMRAHQIIGGPQEAALCDWLDAQGPKAVKFIVTSVPIFPDTKGAFGAPEDKWGGYAEQRTRILEHIRNREHPIRKVVFLSGDVHVSFAAKLQHRGEDMGVYSIISSAFTWPVPGIQKGNFDWEPLAEESMDKDQKKYPGSHNPRPLPGCAAERETNLNAATQATQLLPRGYGRNHTPRTLLRCPKR